MDEYISKHEAYKMLKDKQAEYMQVAVNEAFGTAARMIDQMKPTDVQPAPKWINCKKQMPEDGISILICSERGTVSKATYDSDMGYFYIADSELHYNELDITHWMPLPESPKDGDAE